MLRATKTSSNCGNGLDDRQAGCPYKYVEAPYIRILVRRALGLRTYIVQGRHVGVVVENLGRRAAVGYTSQPFTVEAKAGCHNFGPLST